MTEQKLVQGVGINDADYSIKPKKGPKCPFYATWAEMLRRAYGVEYRARNKTYENCTVCDEWLVFSRFKAWMETQDWHGKSLDKDILCPGNKRYCPESCVFVSRKVNTFITDAAANRGDLPIGVTASRRRYYSCCFKDGVKVYLGCYDTPEEAHKAWLKNKLEQAVALAAEQTDPRVAKALVDRYENYA